MDMNIDSQETMYVYLVYLLRAGFPAGDVQTYVHFEFLLLWIKGSCNYFFFFKLNTFRHTIIDHIKQKLGKKKRGKHQLL